MEVSSIPRLGASVTATINHVIDVVAEGVWVHPREILAATNQFSRDGAGTGQGAQFGHRCTVAGNHDPLAVLNAAEYFSPVVAEIAYGHCVHIRKCITGETPRRGADR